MKIAPTEIASMWMGFSLTPFSFLSPKHAANTVTGLSTKTSRIRFHAGPNMEEEASDAIIQALLDYPLESG